VATHVLARCRFSTMSCRGSSRACLARQARGHPKALPAAMNAILARSTMIQIRARRVSDAKPTPVSQVVLHKGRKDFAHWGSNGAGCELTVCAGAARGRASNPPQSCHTYALTDPPHSSHITHQLRRCFSCAYCADGRCVSLVDCLLSTG
jgi:hypothetical protein